MVHDVIQNQTLDRDGVIKLPHNGSSELECHALPSTRPSVLVEWTISNYSGIRLYNQSDISHNGSTSSSRQLVISSMKTGDVVNVTCKVTQQVGNVFVNRLELSISLQGGIHIFFVIMFRLHQIWGIPHAKTVVLKSHHAFYTGVKFGGVSSTPSGVTLTPLVVILTLFGVMLKLSRV